MKTIEQIQAKIKEHEDQINEILSIDRAEWNDVHVLRIETYLRGRKALLWVLSDKVLLDNDEFEMQAKFECTCFDSTKIF